MAFSIILLAVAAKGDLEIISLCSSTVRFAALESADTSVVAPLTETMTFFGLGAAFLFNRKTEAFSPLVLLGIFLAAMGAIAITIN